MFISVNPAFFSLSFLHWLTVGCVQHSFLALVEAGEEEEEEDWRRPFRPHYFSLTH
jgi:hypothetical protein